MPGDDRPTSGAARLAAASRTTRIGLAVAVLALLCGGAWLIRPLLHPIAMLGYQYPLVTWLPILLGATVAAGSWVVGHRAETKTTTKSVARAGVGAAALVWAVGMIAMPSLQGHALYEQTRYVEGAALPSSTQPRLLPKNAAQRYGDFSDMRHAHLAVDPDADQLVWTAEHKPGPIPRGPSDGWAVQPLDRLDGTLARRAGGFEPAISRVGPGSIRWRAYQRHYFTKVTDYVVVPTGGGKAIAVAPYLGYKGLLVKRPYLKGIYVYHQDGRLEDLTPAQALRRPELVRSGRLFPERLARDIAEAYGYESGPRAVFARRDRTKVSDPKGNPQPYLTNLGDGRIRWVTVAHAQNDEDEVAAIFLTDAASGRTEVWRTPKGDRVLSNRGAARLARGLRLEWTRRVCCDSEGHSYNEDMRTVEEPRPVFAAGRFYYLVSIVPNRQYIQSREPVEKTVLVDAGERTIVEVFDHNDSESDDRLRAFFDAKNATAGKPATATTG